MKTHKFKLNQEEQDLLKSVENDEWQSADNLEAEILKTKKAAESYEKKNARINIRISEADLLQLKQIAAREGLPYQTLISSVLHKFIGGHYKNK